MSAQWTCTSKVPTLILPIPQKLLRSNYLNRRSSLHVNSLQREETLHRLITGVCVNWTRVKQWAASSSPKEADRPQRGYKRRDWDVDRSMLALVQRGLVTIVEVCL